MVGCCWVVVVLLVGLLLVAWCMFESNGRYLLVICGNMVSVSWVDGWLLLVG